MTDGWRLTSRLFASGDRKIELVHVTDDLPDPAQIAAVYTKLAVLFADAKATQENSDAVVHRVELVVTPEIERTAES